MAVPVMLAGCQSLGGANHAGNDGTVELIQRLTRMEQDLSALRRDMDATRPVVERLVGIESDIRLITGRLAEIAEIDAGMPATAVAQKPAPPPAPPASPATAKLPAAPPPPKAAPAPAVSPPSILPPPVVTETAALPAPGPPLSELAPMVPQGGHGNAATAKIGSGSAKEPEKPHDMDAAGGQVAVHLASYRTLASSRSGWEQLRHRFPAELKGLSPRIANLETTDGRGTFYRLLAGPLPNASEARKLCGRLSHQGVYCTLTETVGSPAPQLWQVSVLDGTGR